MFQFIRRVPYYIIKYLQLQIRVWLLVDPLTFIFLNDIILKLAE